MDVLQAIRFYFWAGVGALCALFLLYVAVAGFIQGARRDAVALAVCALASALLAVSLFFIAQGEETPATALPGVAGLALFFVVVKYWKSGPDTPPSQARQPKPRQPKSKRHRRRRKSAS